MTARNCVLIIIILLRNIAPMLACAPATEPSTTSTQTTTTTTAQCTAIITIGQNGLSGFGANCIDNVCTFADGESFIINQNACALREVNRPFFIDGADQPGTEEAPTSATTVTCSGGVLSASGGVTASGISNIACSDDCVVNFAFNTAASATGTDGAFGNCPAGIFDSNGSQCLADNTGLSSRVAANAGAAAGGLLNLCDGTEALAITDAQGVTRLFPSAAGEFVANEDLMLTCETDGDVTAVIDDGNVGGLRTVVNDVIGLGCVVR